MDSLTVHDVIVFGRALRVQLRDWEDLLKEILDEYRENPQKHFLNITPGMIREMHHEMGPTLDKFIVRCTDAGMDDLVPELVKKYASVQELLGEFSKIVK